MNVSGLVSVLKVRLDKFSFQIVDEDLQAHDSNYLRYDSPSLNWLAFPAPNVRGIINAVEAPILSSAYTVTPASGYITFSTARAADETIRADYSYFPFTDSQLTDFVESAIKQIQVLIFHPIDSNNILADYQEAILKKCYSLAIRTMQFPTVKYFTISVGGRSIGKEGQVAQCNQMIDDVEKELLMDINALRYFNKTNVLS
jgi:hypothetical protein